MVEVLVTLVILSTGLLSMATLQITGLRSTNSSTYRTQATLIASDIAERMRTNPAAIRNNNFMDVDSSTNIDCNVLPVPYCEEFYNASTSAVTPAQVCTSDEMAAFDINVWFCGQAISSAGTGIRAGGVQKLLPSALATIMCTDTNPGGVADADLCTNRSPHIISITWNEPNPIPDSDNPIVSQNLSMTIQP